MTTERQFHRAKAHVARGHEQELRRLQAKGRAVGGALGLLAAGPEMYAAIRGKRAPSVLHTLAPVLGIGAGHLGGSHVALKRLELSQLRGGHGHYSGLRKRAGVVQETAKKMSAGINATRRQAPRAVVQHTPLSQPLPAPAVEPTTKIGSRASELAGLGMLAIPPAHMLVNKLRGKKTSEGAETAHHALDLAGLGTLALPYLRKTAAWTAGVCESMGKIAQSGGGGAPSYDLDRVPTDIKSRVRATLDPETWEKVHGRKLAAYMKSTRKDTNKRKADDTAGGEHATWSGRRAPKIVPQTNDPEPESWRGHDF